MLFIIMLIIIVSTQLIVLTIHAVKDGERKEQDHYNFGKLFFTNLLSNIIYALLVYGAVKYFNN